MTTTPRDTPSEVSESLHGNDRFNGKDAFNHLHRRGRSHSFDNIMAPTMQQHRSRELPVELSHILEQVSDLSLERPFDHPPMRTSHHPYPPLSAVPAGLNHQSSRSEWDSFEADSSLERSDSSLVRNAPRIPESPDLSVSGEDSVASSSHVFLRHVLQPFFSPASNQVSIGLAPTCPQVHFEPNHFPHDADDEPRGLYLSPKAGAPPPMPLFGNTPEGRKAPYTPTIGRVLKMRKVDHPTALVFSSIDLPI
jgi:hypothetical protein